MTVPLGDNTTSQIIIETNDNPNGLVNFPSKAIYQCFPPRINIKGGGVHQWYMTFDQQG